MTTPLTFTDANGVKWLLEAWPCCAVGERPVPQPYHRRATLSDLRAALPEGYALVRLTGEEASDDDLAAIEESAYTGEFGYAVEQRRALYLAGLAAGRAEREAREREPSSVIPPSSFELKEIQYHGERGKPADAKEDEGRRALYMAGVVAGERESEVWRLAAARTKVRLEEMTAERDEANTRAEAAEIRAEHADARARQYLLDDGAAAHVLDELAATKAKLAEVVQERDDAAKSAEYLAKRYNATSDELERARRVVEAAGRLVNSYERDGNGVGVRSCEDTLIAEVKSYRALASATSSQPAEVDASVIASGKSISETERRPTEAETAEWALQSMQPGPDRDAIESRIDGALATKPATGDHDFSGQYDLASAKCRRCGVEPADYLHQPMPACVPANSPEILDGSTRFTFAVGDTVRILAGDDPRTGKTADIIGLYPKGCATVRVHGEPPPRAPDVYPAFPLACLEKIEPQEEPSPSGEARCQCGPHIAMGSYDAQVVMLTPFRRGPLPQLVGIDACIATEIAWLWLDGIETVASCCGHNKAPAIISVIEDDAERMERLGYELYEYPPGQDGWRWTYRAKSVSRCNAPEPSATVPRSEVEALLLELEARGHSYAALRLRSLLAKESR